MTMKNILKQNIPSAFTACFAPNCGDVLGGFTTSQATVHRDPDRSKQHEELLKMEIGIKDRVSTMMQSDGSFLTEGDNDLILELDCNGDGRLPRTTVSTSAVPSNLDDSSDICEMNTLGEETLEDAEKRLTPSGVLGDSINTVNSKTREAEKPHIKHIPGSYKQSIRSKFDYYRTHHRFNNNNILRPIEEQNGENLQATGSSSNFAHEGTSENENQDPTENSWNSQHAVNDEPVPNKEEKDPSSYLEMEEAPVGETEEYEPQQGIENMPCVGIIENQGLYKHMGKFDYMELFQDISKDDQSHLATPSSHREELANVIINSRRQNLKASTRRVAVDP